MFDRARIRARIARPLLAAAMATAILPLQAAAQDWREVTSFRQRSDESRLDVHVRYGAGELVIRPGDPGELYRVGIHYDSRAFDPVTEYGDGRLEVGVEGTGRGVRLNTTKGGIMTLSLSPDIPLDLDLHFGAVEADMEFGGLRLSNVDVETGASDTKIAFSSPNPESCEALDISVGAATLEARGLGNANCARVMVEGGVGEVKLDFSGEWRTDMAADVTIALGSVTFRVPDNVGVRLEKETFLADFDGRRFHKRDGVYYSENWERAERRLTIDLEGAFGTFEVRWIAPVTISP